jgi:hypothetical protein
VGGDDGNNQPPSLLFCDLILIIVGQREMPKPTRKLAGGLLIALGGSLFGICGGSAHEWYPVECCGNNDCAEVEHATYDRARGADGALAILAVTTALGTALVPSNFPQRESRDGKMHACMRPGEGEMRLICLFVPPS